MPAWLKPLLARLAQLLDGDWGNCITLARHLVTKVGGYDVRRPTRHKHWFRWLRFLGIRSAAEHRLWLPPECPEKGTPCPYLVSAVPAKPFKGIFKKFPLPWFRWLVKSGDM